MSEVNFETPLVKDTPQKVEPTKVSKLPIVLSVLALSISAGVAVKLCLDTKTTKETSTNLYNLMDKVDSRSGELNSIKQSLESLDKRTLTLENTPHISLKSHKTLVKEVGDLTSKISVIQESSNKSAVMNNFTSKEINRKHTELVELTKNMYDMLVALDAENQTLAKSIAKLDASEKLVHKTLMELEEGKTDVDSLIELQKAVASISEAMKSLSSGQRIVSNVENLEVLLVDSDKALVKDKLVGGIPFVVTVGQEISGATIEAFKDGKVFVKSE